MGVRNSIRAGISFSFPRARVGARCVCNSISPSQPRGIARGYILLSTIHTRPTNSRSIDARMITRLVDRRARARAPTFLSRSVSRRVLRDTTTDGHQVGLHTHAGHAHRFFFLFLSSSFPRPSVSVAFFCAAAVPFTDRDKSPRQPRHDHSDHFSATYDQAARDTQRRGA